MDYFLISILVVGVFLFGVMYGKFLLIKRMVDLLSENELKELELAITKIENSIDEQSTNVLKQEVVNGHVYLYDLSGNFICQGSTWEEVASRYGEIDKREVLVECDNDRRYSIVAGKIKN